MSDELYFVTEVRIEAENDATIRASAELREHVLIINHALDLISSLPRDIVHTSDPELFVQRLMIRCFNSGAASLRLTRGGYYQPALSMVRDLIETTFLLDLFERKPEEIMKWVTFPAKQRESRFSTFNVRKKLDDLDGNKNSLRSETFKSFSNFAAHPTPEGFSIISPNSMTQLGPFADADRVTAVLQELAKHLSYAAVVCGMHAPKDSKVGNELKAKFYVPLKVWLGKYMPGAVVTF